MQLCTSMFKVHSCGHVVMYMCVLRLSKCSSSVEGQSDEKEKMETGRLLGWGEGGFWIDKIK